MNFTNKQLEKIYSALGKQCENISELVSSNLKDEFDELALKNQIVLLEYLEIMHTIGIELHYDNANKKLERTKKDLAICTKKLL